MTDPHHARLRQLFDQALELPPAVRSTFLDKKCAADPELRRRLEAMLAAAEGSDFLSAATGDERAAAVVAAPAASTPPAEAPLREGPGTQIGSYKLLQQIGEGGFGAVFLAEQREPVARKVALKIIKLGMDTRQVVARFEQERQALALMDHPNIAKVLDAGATDTGRPYFVMELCKGLSIVEYCDKNKLTIDERLQLMEQVCHAVQHAHAKGIIHRDLKPSNILVGNQDGRPHAKVIDFGIAKATSQKLTDKTLFTEHEQVIGTLQYMSPEQAEGSVDIDTRTDVYSLGVLLYELLTGSTPFDRKTIKDAMYSEVRRMIREVEPARPSTRIGNSRETLASVAAQRRVEPRRLGLLVRGELDWIVMKALEKDRARRYETANGLAMDLRRFLCGEAVQAAPPSAIYRLRKLVRRNKATFAAGLSVAAALLIGLVGFAWQADVAAGERDLARAAQRSEAEQRVAAETATAAEAEARKQAEDVAMLMESLFEGIDPEADATLGMSLKDQILARVDGLASELERSTAAPLVQARLQYAFGKTLMALSEYDRAAPMMERAATLRREQLGPTDPATVEARLGFAAALEQGGNLRDALRRIEELRAEVGDDPAAAGLELRELDHMVGMVYQAMGRSEEALAAFETAAAATRQTSGPDTEDNLIVLHTLGTGLRDVGRLAEAADVLRDVLRRRAALLGADSTGTLMTANSLAVTYATAGRHDEAIELQRDTRDRLLARFGPAHQAVLNSEANLALAIGGAGRWAEALPMLEAAFRASTERRGAEDNATVRLAANLARAFGELGRHEEAVRVLEPSLPRMLAVFGPVHAFVREGYRLLAASQQRCGRPDAAERTLRDSIERVARAAGDENAAVLELRRDLAGLLLAQGKEAQADDLLRDVHAAQTRTLGAADLETLRTAHELGVRHFHAGHASLAIPLFEHVLAHRTALLGPRDPRTLDTQANLGAAYWATRRLDRSIPTLEQAFAGLRETGSDEPRTLRVAADLLVNYADAQRQDHLIEHGSEWLPKLLREGPPAQPTHLSLLWPFLEACQAAGRLDAAVTAFEVARERLVEGLGADHPVTMHTSGTLGSALWAAGRSAEAVPVFEDLVARTRTAFGDDDPRTVTITCNLAVNLRAVGRLDEAVATLRELATREGFADLPPPTIEFVQRERASARARAGRGSGALAVAAEGVAAARAAATADERALATALAQGGTLLLDLEGWARAEPVLRECLALRERLQPEAWTTDNTRSQLGGALLALGRLDEAEPLLRAGYAGMKEREAAIPPPARHRLADAAERLARFCEATGRADEAAEWRRGLDELRATGDLRR